MSESHMTHAATDGPAGTAAVELPRDVDAARSVRARYGNCFWCTTEAGGCGCRLTTAIGEVLRPHFRHHAGSTCAFATGAREAGAAYQHLDYQRALERWLRAQGFEPHLEHEFDDRGRADLHVVVADIAHSIEVQLTTIPEATWDARNARCARHVDRCTWLHGPGCEKTRERDLYVSTRGHVLEIRRNGGGEVSLGTRWLNNTVWVALSDCRMTADGIATPHTSVASAELEDLDASRARFQLWVTEELERRAEAERRRREEADRRRLLEKNRLLEEAARPDGEKRRESTAADEDSARHVRAFAPTLPAPGRRTLSQWRATYPEMAGWAITEDWRWLVGLPSQLHEAARWSAYVARCLYARAHVADLDHPELTPVENLDVREALFRAGLAEPDSGGDAMWTRPSHLRSGPPS